MFFIVASSSTFSIFAIYYEFLMWLSRQKWFLEIMIPIKCYEQNDRMACAAILCFGETLQFWLYVAIKTSILKLRLLLSLLWPIKSFYRSYVCCIHNTSSGCNRSNRFSRSNRANRSNRSKISNRSNRSNKSKQTGGTAGRRINRARRSSAPGFQDIE